VRADQIILQFERDGAGLVPESGLTHRYLWGKAVDQILADEIVDDGGAEDVLWTLGDHLNTVRDLAAYDAQNDQTAIANHRVFDAFGSLTSETNAAVDCLLAFTAKPFDTDTSLQYNINRWYEPTTGKWISEDPIGFDGV
jgi:RHS repeat-associated protein